MKMYFEKIKRFFDLHLYTAAQVFDFAAHGVITEDEARAICGGESVEI